MLWRLLRTHISASQLIGFSLANLVGLTIVILAVQFYRDVQPVFDDDESFIRKDYLVITRSVTSAGAMMGGASEFSDDDIGEDGLYYVEIVPAVQDGNGQAVIGHFTQDSSEEAVDFAIIDVAIEDGKVTDITDSGFTADLSVISD